jgi:hypothetical protein
MACGVLAYAVGFFLPASPVMLGLRRIVRVTTHARRKKVANPQS